LVEEVYKTFHQLSQKQNERDDHRNVEHLDL
jgi:hypothetical protein